MIFSYTDPAWSGSGEFARIGHEFSRSPPRRYSWLWQPTIGCPVFPLASGLPTTPDPLLVSRAGCNFRFITSREGICVRKA
ncbi:MAG: hypothetical protein QOJ99_239 [Bryobacterales bacterium]|jgi:hypothetical protein|nr:hypothetical protein [Bryobacterales bacterium]